MFVLLLQTFSFPTQNGVTPLFAASQSNHGGIVTLLLNASALVDLPRNVSRSCFNPIYGPFSPTYVFHVVVDGAWPA